MHTHLVSLVFLVELLVSLLSLSHIIPQVTVSIQLAPSCDPSFVFSTGLAYISCFCAHLAALVGVPALSV
ncbi:hypothetical protein BC628DRAFT_1369736 [Trametes gibbosa]|nr:hypothetical protein BC628DRAFT_1369736 [Trametes gibbosa]